MADAFKHEALTHTIIGSAMEVHTLLGNGFQEAVCQRALAMELRIRKISFERELEMPLFYKGESVWHTAGPFLYQANRDG